MPLEINQRSRLAKAELSPFATQVELNPFHPITVVVTTAFGASGSGSAVAPAMVAARAPLSIVSAVTPMCCTDAHSCGDGGCKNSFGKGFAAVMQISKRVVEMVAAHTSQTDISTPHYTQNDKLRMGRGQGAPATTNGEGVGRSQTGQIPRTIAAPPMFVVWRQAVPSGMATARRGRSPSRAR